MRFLRPKQKRVAKAFIPFKKSAVGSKYCHFVEIGYDNENKRSSIA